MTETWFEQVKRFDASRPNVPGEHWLSLAVGVGLWVATRRHPSVTVRLLASVVGTVLVARAASGRDIPPPLRRLPFADRLPGRHDWIG